jgi:DNA-binding PadR family transcriptional regulator
LRKLQRQPAHAGLLIDELQRSRSVRVPRVYSLLERMRADGTLSSDWQHDDDARPRRVYAVARGPEFGLEAPSAQPAQGA